MSFVGNAGGLSAADVAAVMGNNGGYGNGFGGFGGDGAWWLIVLFLFALNGNNGWGNGFGGGGNMAPLMFANQNNDVQRGFDQQAVMNGINTLSTLTSTNFANAEVSRCNATTNLLMQMNDNQNATNANMNALAMSLQNCCCENRLGLANLNATILAENCADRQAVSDGIRDVIANQNNGFQRIIDRMCQQEIDALKAQNAQLQTQLQMSNLRASQTDQTARILADNAAQTVALEQYLNPVPVPAYVVQNPNRCNCGCGNGNYYGYGVA